MNKNAEKKEVITLTNLAIKAPDIIREMITFPFYSELECCYKYLDLTNSHEVLGFIASNGMFICISSLYATIGECDVLNSECIQKSLSENTDFSFHLGRFIENLFDEYKKKNDFDKKLLSQMKEISSENISDEKFAEEGSIAILKTFRFPFRSDYYGSCYEYEEANHPDYTWGTIKKNGIFRCRGKKGFIGKCNVLSKEDILSSLNKDDVFSFHLRRFIEETINTRRNILSFSNQTTFTN